MNIQLAPGLPLPMDVVTQTIGIVAMKRAGKSYLARRMVEQLFHAGQQVVVVDPKGDWWGIKSSADGRGAGLPMVILGGERGDVPLEPGSGEVVAELVVEDRVSAVLDLSDLRKHEVATFMASFLETLYRLKNHERYRTPMMLTIDEADAIAPQMSGRQGMKGGNTERMIGAANDIVRRGGQRGIGCMLITQRTAVLSKDILTQVQILIALRTIGPQDLAAMRLWIDVHGTDAERKTLMASLPALPVGDAWVWSPGWPIDAGIFQRIRTSPIETYDSGRTPKYGERPVEPATVAEVDLDAFRVKMAETIERKKESDPKLLKAELDHYKKALAAVRTAPGASEERLERLLALSKKNTEQTNAIVGHVRTTIGHVRRVLKEQVEMTSELLKGLDKTLASPGPLVDSQTGQPIDWRGADDRAHDAADAPPLPEFATRVRGPLSDDYYPYRRPMNGAPIAVPKAAQKASGDLKGGERQMLLVLAQHGATTESSIPLPHAQLATLSGYAMSGGTFKQYVSHLVKDSYAMTAVPAELGLLITTKGLARIGNPPLRKMTRAEVVAIWLGRFKKGERHILGVVLQQPRSGALTMQKLAEMAGFEPSGGTFKQYVSNLARNGLLARTGDQVRLGPTIPAS